MEEVIPLSVAQDRTGTAADMPRLVLRLPVRNVRQSAVEQVTLQDDVRGSVEVNAEQPVVMLEKDPVLFQRSTPFEAQREVAVHAAVADTPNAHSVLQRVLPGCTRVGHPQLIPECEQSRIFPTVRVLWFDRNVQELATIRTAIWFPGSIGRRDKDVAVRPVLAIGNHPLPVELDNAWIELSVVVMQNATAQLKV